MCDLAVLLLHLPATVARLAGPGGARAVLAESVLVTHQLLILNRSRKRSPNLRPADRVVTGLCAVFMRPSGLIRSAIVFKPATLLNLHRALIQRKYRRLFASKRPMKPGPKGPSQDVIAAVVDMKQRNPSCAERFVRSIREECLDRVIPFGESHLRRTIAEYVEHYHRERNHQGIENMLIAGAPVAGLLGRIRRRPRLGGVLNYYERVA